MFVELNVVKTNEENISEKRLFNVNDIKSVKPFYNEDGDVIGSLLYFFDSKNTVLVSDKVENIKNKVPVYEV